MWRGMRRLAGPRRPEGGHAALYLGLGLREPKWPRAPREFPWVLPGSPRRRNVYYPGTSKVKTAQQKVPN